MLWKCRCVLDLQVCGLGLGLVALALGVVALLTSLPVPLMKPLPGELPGDW